MNPIPETHQQGAVTLENMPPGGFPFRGDFGLQAAADGRVWVCLDGIAFLRFSPHPDGKSVNQTYARVLTTLPPDAYLSPRRRTSS